MANVRDDLYGKFRILYDKGASDHAKAKECGCSGAAVCRWRKRNNLEANFSKHASRPRAGICKSLCMYCGNGYVSKCAKIAWGEKIYDEAFDKQVAGNNSDVTYHVTVVTSYQYWVPDRDAKVG